MVRLLHKRATSRADQGAAIVYTKLVGHIVTFGLLSIVGQDNIDQKVFTKC